MHILFSLGTILFFYVSIPVVFIVPVTSVPPTNFINVLFPLLQNAAFFSIYDEPPFLSILAHSTTRSLKTMT